MRLRGYPPAGAPAWSYHGTPAGKIVGSLPGPRGIQGPPGSGGGEGGTNWFSGDGPPEDVDGASSGDYYLDTTDFTLYKET